MKILIGLRESLKGHCRIGLSLCYLQFFCCFMTFPLKMLSWNIIGDLRKGRKQRFSRFLNMKTGLSFLGIVEIKRGCIDKFVVRKI